MSQSGTATGLNLGFLTVLQEATGYLGGYLVTNVWGRPLEFRLSTAVQPNRVQQILYAGTLSAYICADLIGKTLVDKTATPVQLIVTDTADVLDLRQRLEVPVVWRAPQIDGPTAGVEVRPGLYRHARFPGDTTAIAELLEKIDGQQFDLAEPFARIREAVSEARKMGVTKTAA